MDCELSGNVALVVEHYIESGSVLLHPIVILVDVRGIDDKQELCLVDFIYQQIVDCSTVGIQHHAIINFSFRGIGDVVGEYVVYVALSIGACHHHFAHVADVEHTAVIAHCIVLVDNSTVFYWHHETSEGAHLCTKFNVAVVETCFFLFHIGIVF